MEDIFDNIVQTQFKDYSKRLLDLRVANSRQRANGASNICKHALYKNIARQISDGRYPLTHMYNMFGEYGAKLHKQIMTEANMEHEDIQPINLVPQFLDERKPHPPMSTLALSAERQRI